MELITGQKDRDYPLDTAYIDIVNKLSKPFSVFGKITECYQCPDVQVTTVHPMANATISIDTKYNYILKIVSKKFGHNSTDGGHIFIDHNQDIEVCTISQPFNEKSLTRLTIDHDHNKTECVPETITDGVNSYIPLYTAIGVFFILGSIFYMLTAAYQRYKSGRGCYQSTDNQSLTSDARTTDDDTLSPVSMSTIESTVSDQNADQRPDVKKFKLRRVKSLDAFRGLIILLMIFVNYGGGGYVFLEHKSWYGISIADIIFPAFIFMMGMSITLSVKSSLTRSKDYLILILKVVKRSIKLFVIGVVLNTDMTPLSKIRIPGVLQRFAICYLVVALLHIVSVYRGNKFISRTEEPAMRQLLLIFYPEIVIYVGVLFTYSYFTLYYKYSDTCPIGYQGPGGYEYGGKYINCTGGAANYIDRKIFGVDHIYQYPTSVSVYQSTMAHDPEGTLGTLTGVLLTYIGLICGRVLLLHRDHYKRLIRWFILATVLGLLAFALSSTDYIPVVKNLWSLSYVSLTGSISIFILIIFYLWIDVLKAWSKGTPFHYPGTNAILLYIGHVMCRRYLPFYFDVDDANHSWLLFRDLSSVGIWLIISMYLYYSKIFFTL